MIVAMAIAAGSLAGEKTTVVHPQDTGVALNPVRHGVCIAN
jgi:hypothetical protein